MKKKVVTEITLIFFAVSMLTLAFNNQSAEASGTIYIRADGSIDPLTANITTFDNITYTFTGNINESIVIERDNIVVDGAGYTLQGTGSGTGIDLSERSNVTIKNTQIEAFQSGIYLYQSHNNIISGNNITNNQYGYLGSSSSNYNIISGNSITENNGIGIASTTASHNIFSGNNITNNDNGIMLWSPSNSSVSGNSITENNWKGIYLSSGSYNIVSGNTVTNNTQGIYLDSYPNNNTIYHNNLVNNTNQVYLYNSVNVWDDGYPSGGNYWSNYAGVDLYSGLHQNETGSDGIGDVAHVIDASNTDNYPLMKPYYGSVRNLNTGQSYRTIQKAINNASEGDTILALSGTYYEHVVVNKSISLIGEDKDKTIIDGNGTGTTVLVKANNTLVTGFSLQKSGWLNSGIMLDRVFNSSIYNNNASNNWFGIYLQFSSNCSVYDNNAADNCAGIELVISSNCFVGRNRLEDNQFGMILDRSANCFIYANKASNNSLKGIVLEGSSNCTLHDNNMSGNSYNLGVKGDALEHFVHNIDVSNAIDGKPVCYWINQHNMTAPTDVSFIGVVNSTGITVEDLDLKNNEQGLLLAFSENCTIRSNNVSHNYWGIYLYSSVNVTTYHNNFNDNDIQVETGAQNVWDDGYPSAGNYWNDYTDVDLYSGSSQDIPGSDGIWDHHYIIDANNRDHYPLVQQWVPDITPPETCILSPQNTTYATSSVPLTFTVNEATSWIGYSLDNQANVTITGNTTLAGLAIGPHNVIVYANDTYGNMGSSDKVYFTRVLNDVAILDVTASPTETYVNQIVKINVTVKNKGTVYETFNVTAYYDLALIDTQSIIDLAPDSNITITFNWNTSGVQKGTYTISAEAEVVSGETNTTDNSYIDDTVTILNSPPTIDFFTPTDTEHEVNEGSILKFTHTSSDPDDDPLDYSWLLDSVEQSTAQNWTYSPTYDDAGTHNVTLVVSDGELTDSHQWNVTVINVNRPPVIDTSYPSTDPTISEGKSQEFNVTYSDPDGDFTTVQWYLNGTPTATIDSYTFIADYASAGIYNVTVVVSDSPSQTSHQWTLTVTNVERDIAIINVIPSKNIVGEGYSVSINVTITNQGELAETFNVTAYANTTIVATLTNITLTSGNSTAITFTWNTTGFAKGKYTIWAYAWPVQGETHTTDNMLVAPTVIHVVMPGDADLDKVITILDVVKVTSRYAAKKGDQNYDANVDWNDDGKIDILDVVIVTSRYAQKDP